VVADRDARDLLLARVVEHDDAVVAADRDEAVAPVAAVGRPVRLVADLEELVRERVAVHDRGVVGHRAGDA
jgi:hypothetical protein